IMRKKSSSPKWKAQSKPSSHWNDQLSSML
ncbi:hypothetical protein GYH30_045443, partial [Glycine max]